MSLELSRVCSAISPSPTLAIDAKAKEMAAVEADPQRKKELERISSAQATKSSPVGKPVSIYLYL